MHAHTLAILLILILVTTNALLDHSFLLVTELTNASELTLSENLLRFEATKTTFLLVEFMLCVHYVVLYIRDFKKVNHFPH